MELEIIPLVIKYNNTVINKVINSDTKQTIKDIFYEIFNNSANSANSANPRELQLADSQPLVFYILNGRLVSPDMILADVAEPDIINTLECHMRIRGGFELEDIPIIGQVFQLFAPIVNPIVGIGKVFIFLLQIIVWFGKFIYWSIMFLIWAFSDLLNPIKLVADFWGSIVLILLTLMNTVFGVIMGLSAFVVNQIGQWMGGFWGWDQSGLTKQDKESKYFEGIDRNKGRKCYLTNNNRVPFSILLGTILCPPLGIFMDMGITGWMNIFICALLTLLFYLPGLFYALLVIYS
jgi:uncharacterized membrane protein YqaE (UPF0057 family)